MTLPSLMIADTEPAPLHPPPVNVHRPSKGLLAGGAVNVGKSAMGGWSFSESDRKAIWVSLGREVVAPSRMGMKNSNVARRANGVAMKVRLVIQKTPYATAAVCPKRR